MFSMIFTVFLLGISYFQGCGGTLNGTIPSSGTLQWTIIAADQLNVLVIFSDWTVSITTKNQHTVFKYTIFKMFSSRYGMQVP
jgi:hypothetical protein